MAELLDAWPTERAWPKASPAAPEREEALRCCDCGGVKDPRPSQGLTRCARCSAAQRAETHERVRVLLATYRPREVAGLLNVSLATVYRVRASL